LVPGIPNFGLFIGSLKIIPGIINLANQGWSLVERKVGKFLGKGPVVGTKLGYYCWGLGKEVKAF